jgi:hypothetical protein
MIKHLEKRRADPQARASEYAKRMEKRKDPAVMARVREASRNYRERPDVRARSKEWSREAYKRNPRNAGRHNARSDVRHRASVLYGGAGFAQRERFDASRWAAGSPAQW